MAELSINIQSFNYEDFENVRDFVKGGFAYIKQADWPRSDRRVILKKLIDYDVQRFVQEVKMHISSHWSKNVVRFFGIIKESPELDEYIMVMEYAEHNSLRDFLRSRNNNVNWDIRYQLSLDIAKGLNCLHSHDIVHRDLHTENIVIKRINCESNCPPRFIAQITDFGSSILVNNGEVDDFNGGCGQVAFTDPNYLNNNRYERNKESDIYSLGVIFWEISSSRIPFANIKPRIPGRQRNIYLSYEIMGGLRETPIPSTPPNYFLLYQACWELIRSRRPQIEQVIEIISNITIFSEYQVRNILADNNTQDDSDDANSNELDIDDF